MLQMKKSRLLLTAITAVGALALTVACGSDSSSGGGGNGGGGGNTKCTDCKAPPAEPGNGAQGDGSGVVMAVNKLFLGDTTRDGAPDPNAWKDFGYDLDGFKSTKNSSNHCKPNGEGANKASIQTDGYDGIDNSFGSNIMPIITDAGGSGASSVNSSIDEGKFTLLLKIDKLGSGKNYVGLPAELFAGAELGSAPKWDGTDAWPVYCELMQDCQTSGTKQIGDGNKSKVQFPASYMANGTWVSGSRGDINLSLAVSGFSLDLVIHQAVITADITGVSQAAATNGVIAGVLATDELSGSLKKMAGLISTSLCDGSALDTILQAVAGASDIMADGTQDSSKVCDGISIGLGFDMKAAALGTVNEKQPPQEDPCANQ